MYVMDQISRKTPNPKCRLYWRLIEFIDILVFSALPVWISLGVRVHTVCNRGGDGWPETDKHMPPSKPLLVNF